MVHGRRGRARSRRWRGGTGSSAVSRRHPGAVEEGRGLGAAGHEQTRRRAARARVVAALMAAGVVDRERIADALGEDSPLYRRLGAFALFGAGTTVDGAERTALVRQALDDRDWTVRFDALRAGSAARPRATAAVRSPRRSATTACTRARAIDALGRSCLTGEEAETLTDSSAQRAAHAAGHRCVAARGARAGRAREARTRARGDGDDRLSHPQSRGRCGCMRRAPRIRSRTSRRSRSSPRTTTTTCARPRWCRLQRIAGVDRSQPAFIAALGRTDYQLVRTAAIGAQRADARASTSSRALVDALARMTAQKQETSRDTRLALIERIRERDRRRRRSSRSC